MKIQESAVTRLQQLKSEETNPDLKFRVFVQGGGCSGMSYGFQFDDLTVLVDSVSMEYLRDAHIEWREDAMGASFVIENPQAATTCGCGSSFSPY